MNDDGSARSEITSARQTIEALQADGRITKRVFKTLSAGLDALARQDELARKSA